jgi:hypothetical protein
MAGFGQVRPGVSELGPGKHRSTLGQHARHVKALARQWLGWRHHATDKPVWRRNEEARVRRTLGVRLSADSSVFRVRYDRRPRAATGQTVSTRSPRTPEDLVAQVGAGAGVERVEAEPLTDAGMPPLSQLTVMRTPAAAIAAMRRHLRSP